MESYVKSELEEVHRVNDEGHRLSQLLKGIDFPTQLVSIIFIYTESYRYRERQVIWF